MHVSTDATVESLIEQLTELRYDLQTEVLEPLLAMRSQCLGFNDDDKEL
jgi:archaellum biogenesis ATPase FlaH